MSSNDVGAADSAEDRTPYLKSGVGHDDPADAETDLDDLAPEMNPAEEVEMRRNLAVEFEGFEQGMEG